MRCRILIFLLNSNCVILAFFCGRFDIDVYIYSTCTFFDCQADFDVDNVQRRELVHFYGVYRYIRVILLLLLLLLLSASG